MKTEKDKFEAFIDSTTIDGKKLRTYIEEHYVGKETVKNVLEDTFGCTLAVSDAINELNLN